MSPMVKELLQIRPHKTEDAHTKDEVDALIDRIQCGFKIRCRRSRAIDEDLRLLEAIVTAELPHGSCATIDRAMSRLETPVVLSWVITLPSLATTCLA